MKIEYDKIEDSINIGDSPTELITFDNSTDCSDTNYSTFSCSDKKRLKIDFELIDKERDSFYSYVKVDNILYKIKSSYVYFKDMSIFINKTLNRYLSFEQVMCKKSDYLTPYIGDIVEYVELSSESSLGFTIENNQVAISFCLDFEKGGATVDGSNQSYDDFIYSPDGSNLSNDSDNSESPECKDYQSEFETNVIDSFKSAYGFTGLSDDDILDRVIKKPELVQNYEDYIKYSSEFLSSISIIFDPPEGLYFDMGSDYIKVHTYSSIIGYCDKYDLVTVFTNFKPYVEAENMVGDSAIPFGFTYDSYRVLKRAVTDSIMHLKSIDWCCMISGN